MRSFNWASFLAEVLLAVGEASPTERHTFCRQSLTEREPARFGAVDGHKFLIFKNAIVRNRRVIVC